MQNIELSRLRVLCVDDQENMLKLLRTLLAAGGMRDVTTLADGEEALRLVAGGRCDVAISDLQMQPLDGLAFTRKLRAHPDPAIARTPVLLLTGHADPERVTAAKRVGVDDFLIKPISVADLQMRIRRAVTHCRAAAG
jgi:CheY-like chemotaxis protein